MPLVTATNKPSPTVAPEVPAAWKMPHPGTFVQWRTAPNGYGCFAIVTSVGRSSINIILFPPDNKFGIPKDSVRHVDDPWNKVHGVNADTGIWERTIETKLLIALAQNLCPDSAVTPGWGETVAKLLKQLS